MLDYLAGIESEVRGYVRSFPTVFDTASGCWLRDTDGARYLDFFSGAGSLNYGHNNPLAKSALLKYIQRDGIQHSLDMATEAKVHFLRAFERIILGPRGMTYRIQFTGPTGTNSVEAALKLARKVKQRSHVVAFTNAYHGHTLGALAATANRYYHDEHFGSRRDVTHMPFDGYLGSIDTLDVFEKMLLDDSSGLPLPAAVIVEPIQGEGGINVASPEWLRRLEQLCRTHDMLLIVDDIQVGNGRSGNFFSFEQSGIQPDLVCISKSIGAGLPLSLLLIRPESDHWKPGEHTGTFRGNNLAFVAAAAVLEYWADDRFEEHIQSLSVIIEERLRAMVNQYPQLKMSVRGRGLVWGLDVADGAIAKRISSKAFQRGLIIETAGASDQVVKFLPALIMSREELELGLDIIEAIVCDEASLPQKEELLPDTTRGFTLPIGPESREATTSSVPTTNANLI